MFVTDGDFWLVCVDVGDLCASCAWRRFLQCVRFDYRRLLVCLSANFAVCGCRLFWSMCDHRWFLSCIGGFCFVFLVTKFHSSPKVLISFVCLFGFVCATSGQGVVPCREALHSPRGIASYANFMSAVCLCQLIFFSVKGLRLWKSDLQCT